MTAQQPPHSSGGRRVAAHWNTWPERTREIRLADLDFFLVELPAFGLAPASRAVVVRLACDAGQEGWGEAVLPWRAGELASRRDALLPILAGRSIFDIASLVELDTLDSPALRAAVEIASWDLVGQAAGQPLAHLWGGVYRGRVPLAARLPMGPPERTAQLSRELADQGFHVQIVTSSGVLEEDLASIAAMRSSAGDRLEWRFDAEEGYDIARASELCAALASAGARYCLDPLADGTVESLVELRAQVSLPLAATIGAGGSRQVHDLVCGSAIDGIVVCADRMGGLLAARRAAAVAEAAGLAASLAVGSRGGIALAASLQLAAATPSFVIGNESAYRSGGNDLLAEPLETVDGMMTVPLRPGLGISVDRDKLERWSLG
ncbi:MAG: mandelate racemase/muconate lactonizing enzyme family protein [Pirellulales bacterium]|nr:mandelate racemase/muconate lactonizing enzyme family protein [Pirellulales bacterium]